MFQECLEKWRQKEKEFAIKMIQKELNLLKVEFAPDEAFKDRDVKLTYNDWKEETYEVKLDDKSIETWNICFEFACNKKPSWIFNSKADYIVYQIWWEYYIRERWVLLALLSNMQKEEVKWWDWNRARMFLVNKDKLNLLFNKI